MKTMVLYHGGCYDGFCAAWVLWHVFPDATFIPVNYGEPPPDVTGADVYIVDFSYKREVMRDIILKALNVTVLDHHKTAEEELKGLLQDTFTAQPYILFDSSKSGGRLTWEYVQKHKILRKPFPDGANLPWLVAYTEDRDLWRHRLLRSREINAALRCEEFEFEHWEHLCGLISTKELCPGMGYSEFDRYADCGSYVILKEKAIVNSHVKNATEIDMAGHKILCVNATTMISEIGEVLAKGRPFSATYFDKGDGKRIWSLRSEKDSEVDVSRIARSCGGGGHFHAAGFQSEIPFGFLWMETKHEPIK